MQCPGQDNRYWDGEAVFEAPCPHCGNELEFFKDDSQRSCKKCGNRVLNPRIDFGCAAYCPHAEQCLGSMPPELQIKQKNLFKDKVAIAVRKQLVGKEDIYKTATIRTEIAEQLCREEQRGDMAAVLAATLLVSADEPLALLETLNADGSIINAVSMLLNRKEPGSATEQASLDIYLDACRLTALADRKGEKTAPDLKTASAKKYLMEH